MGLMDRVDEGGPSGRAALVGALEASDTLRGVGRTRGWRALTNSMNAQRFVSPTMATSDDFGCP